MNRPGTPPASWSVPALRANARPSLAPASLGGQIPMSQPAMYARIPKGPGVAPYTETGFRAIPPEPVPPPQPPMTIPPGTAPSQQDLMTWLYGGGGETGNSAGPTAGDAAAAAGAAAAAAAAAGGNTGESGVW